MTPVMTHAPKMVYGEGGQLVEVILAAADFRSYLRLLLAGRDWQELPAHLQDAADLLLIDEVRNEKEQARDLDDILAEERLAV